MECVWLRRCLSHINEDEADDINVQVSCACCGGTVKDSNIDQTDEAAEAAAEETEHGTNAEGNLLQSQSSGSLELGKEASESEQSTHKECKRMVSKAAHVHTSPTGTENIFKSQILCE